MFKRFLQALPPLAAPKWTFENTTSTTLSDGSSHWVNVWLHHELHNEGYGDVTVDWRMHVTRDGVPVKLDMWGPNWFTGTRLNGSLNDSTRCTLLLCPDAAVG